MTGDYNNGKDIMPSDISYTKVGKVYLAQLGFIKLNSNTVKFYQASGSTKKEARKELIDMVIEHLRRIR